MKNAILLSLTLLSSLMGYSQGSCSADFTSTSPGGNTAIFTNTSTGTTYYSWDFGDGGTSNTVNPSHVYAVSGTYTVCLTATYNDSITFCMDSICYNVTVTDSAGGSSCDADFTFTTSGNSANFTNTSTGTTDYVWNFGDGNTSSSANPSHTYASSGTYYVCLTASINDSITNCSDSICYYVTVMDSSGCDASFFATSGIGYANFTNTSTGSSLFHSWTFGDGGTSSAVNPMHTYSSTGTYLVCLTITSMDSLAPCTGTYCDSVYISVDSSSVGLNTNDLTEFILFPNPASEIVNVRFDNSISGVVEILDLVGRVMVTKEIENDTAFTVSDFPSGVYLVKVTDNNGNLIGLKKFMRD